MGFGIESGVKPPHSKRFARLCDGLEVNLGFGDILAE
jgi:hypothetical protein